MSLQADLQAAVDKASAASQKLHAVVHGDAASTVETESGPVKTVAKAIADTEAAISASRAELDAKVAAAAGSALSAGESAEAAAGSAALSAERAAKIPDPAPAQALRAVRVNAAGDAYELYEGGGDMVGPAGVADGALARFDGATGKLLKDGGKIQAADIEAGVLGTVAARDIGTAVGNIPDVQADGKLPASVLPEVDLSTRVAKAGDTLTGTLQGPEFKTTGSSAAATGFRIADGTDLAALFLRSLTQYANLGNIGSVSQTTGAMTNVVLRAQFTYAETGGGDLGSNCSYWIDKMADGTLRPLQVGSRYNCNCNCNCTC